MDYKLICGDIVEVCDNLANESIHSIITSPPYFQLRDYGYEAQIGAEETLEEYISALVHVFSKLKHKLRDDGVLWVNIGDTYSSVNKKNYKKGDLIGVPWAFAFAMRDCGWYLKSDVIWHKTNPIPSGAVNRPLASHEYIFMFTKSQNYFYDAESIKENSVEKNKDGTHKMRHKRDVWSIPVASFKGSHFAVFPTKLVEPCILSSTSRHGCCIECGKSYTRHVKKIRYATRPGKNNKIDETGYVNRDYGRHLTHTETIGWLKDCCCSSNSLDKCTVLDPFCGSGTTGVVALQNNCKFIGIDAKQEYLDLAKRRIESLHNESILD